jgi:hypothetical protein
MTEESRDHVIARVSDGIVSAIEDHQIEAESCVRRSSAQAAPSSLKPSAL